VKVLPHQIERAPVINAVANQSEEHAVVDAGVIAFDIAAKDELIFRQQGADVTHGGLGPELRLAVFPRHMVTASREIEPDRLD
jgi:hypothetical protein